MGAQLNIKDAETVRLAREFADATGQPITKAIRQALQHALQQREAEIQATIARVREIGREFRASMPEEMRGKSSREWMDDLYDDDGLPK